MNKKELNLLWRKSPDAMRSCWECNPCHVGLKRVKKCLFWCFACGRKYYNGKYLTLMETKHT